MEAISYLLQRTVINSLKELRKRPLKIILYLLFFGLMLFAIFTGIKTERSSIKNSIDIFNSIFLALTLILLFLSIKSGIEKGNSLFRLSDVNFLFPAPIKPQKILIYGFIKQIYTSFVFIIIILFQTPNLYMHFPVKSYAGVLIAGNMFILSFLCSVISIFIYSIGSIEERNKKIIRSILYGLLGLFSLGALYYVTKNGNILTGLITYFNLPFFKYIPIVGWSLNVFNGAIYGVTPMTFLYMALPIFVIFLILYIIYSLDLDYYEDALDTTMTKEEGLARAKSGNNGFNQLNSKVKKAKGNFKYNGAKAILSKQILESKKTGSTFIDKTTLFFAVTSLVTASFMKTGSIDGVLYMLIYMTLIFSSANKWTLELKNHYIYLIPESSIKKILYSTFLENIKSLITGLIIFISVSFIYKVSIFQGIILAFTYASFSAIILYSDLVIRRMIGDRVSIIVERFLNMIITAIFVLPGIILAFTLGNLVSKYTGIYGRYIIQIIYNVLASILLVTLSKGIFEKLEMR